MATFEEPIWDSSRENHHDVVLELPEDIDADWCQAFVERYGRGIKRSKLESSFCILEEIPPNCVWYNYKGIRHYRGVDVADHTQDPEGVIDGTVVGALMVPHQPESRDDPLEYEPYVILNEVENSGLPLTYSYETRVLVPLTGMERLLLYD